MENFNRAIALNNGQADAYFHRGNLQARLGNRQGAIADDHKAVALYAAQGNKKEHLKATSTLQEFTCLLTIQFGLL